MVILYGDARTRLDLDLTGDYSSTVCFKLYSLENDVDALPPVGGKAAMSLRHHPMWLSDTRVSPQLVAGSPPCAIGPGVAASRGCRSAACDAGAGPRVCGRACGGCTSRCAAACKRGIARGSRRRRVSTASTRRLGSRMHGAAHLVRTHLHN